MKTQKFENVELEGYTEAGTPSGSDDGYDTNACCVNCGSSIRHIFLTNYGPMGGDCYATLTGDNSTRSEVRRTVKKIEKSLSAGYIKNPKAIIYKKKNDWLIKLYEKNPFTDLFQYTFFTRKEIVRNAIITILENQYDITVILKE